MEKRDHDIYLSALGELELLCRERFSEIGSHGWEHVRRVRNLSRLLGEREGADLQVLDVAALFHDTMRQSEDHALMSAEFADGILADKGFSRGFRSRVSEAIATHSYSAGRAARSLEAKVLSDADRLDAMGAVGIYRTIQYNLEHGLGAERVVRHIREKLLNLQGTLHTSTARSMGDRRIKSLEAYLCALEEELSDSGCP